ncbi:hypothetical protein ACP70R_026733 [Stipagrostis hirtigluma subsp. patula]
MAPAPATATAAGTRRGKRKRPLSEDDVYLLLHRYAPGTILTALQEVAQHAEGRRIDWRALAARSATGITSARELQMLWRHFAYRHDLAESVGAGDPPLDDDSDLECEIEPVPNPSKEALSEASALAKILISGSSRDQALGHRVNLEAPALNSPNEKIVRVPSDKQLAQNHRLTNVMGPISNTRQASHTGPSPDPLDAKGPSTKKKKPKTWSKEEDADLTAGVQKYGEGKWLDILHKCNFHNTRTVDQLSQRWTLICKRSGSSKPAISKQVSVASSEERKAALKAFSMAVDYNPLRKTSNPRSGAQQQSSQHTSTVSCPSMPPPAPLPLPVPTQVPMPAPVTVQVQSPLPQGQLACTQEPPPKVSNASSTTRKNSKKQAAQQNRTVAPSSIQAAAIAAGGRIATGTTAANFLKAAQSKNSVHIRARVTGSSKSSTSSKASAMVVEPGTQLSSGQHAEPRNTSAPYSSPSVLTTHAAGQVHGVSEVAAINPPEPSAGVNLLGTKKALSTTPLPASCDIVQQDDDSKFCVITIDDLFPEDAKQLETLRPKAKQPDPVGPKAKQPNVADPKAKQSDTVDRKVEKTVDSKDADMLEFDQYVASQGGSINMSHLDESKTVKSTPGAQDLVGCQKKQLKLVSTVQRSYPVSAGVPATEKKTITPVTKSATPMPTGTLPIIVGGGNATVQNGTLARNAAGPATTGGQNPLLKKANQTSSNAAVGSRVPSSSMTMNSASRMNPPARSQASTVVNGASKVNPLASNQAGTLVNRAGQANTRASQ